MRLLAVTATLVTILGAQPPAPASTIVVRAAHLISGGGDAVSSPGIVVVRGDRIQAVGGGAPIPADARVIDLERYRMGTPCPRSPVGDRYSLSQQSNRSLDDTTCCRVFTVAEGIPPTRTRA